MKNGFRTNLIKDRLHFLTIADINDMQIGCGRKVFPAPAAEIVEDEDRVLSGEQRVNDVASDKARPARDKNPHFAPLFDSARPIAEESPPILQFSTNSTMR